MSELRFENVCVRYGSGRRAMSAVDAVDLTVPSGQVVGLVGESGSGKSTLARAAVGLAPLAAGRVLLDGKELNRRGGGRGRRPLQMVFQDPYASLDPRMSVGGAITEAILKGAFPDADARRAEVARLLDLVGLDAGHAAARPGRLSGGQRQRVALARALAARPDVVIADEITSALDVSIQGTVLNLVRDLQRSMRLGMLFISHNLAVVRYVSDLLAVMYLGRIVEYGPAAQVLSDPQHPYTRELLAAAPRTDARPGPDRPQARPLRKVAAHEAASAQESAGAASRTPDATSSVAPGETRIGAGADSPADAPIAASSGALSRVSSGALSGASEGRARDRGGAVADSPAGTSPDGSSDVLHGVGANVPAAGAAAETDGAAPDAGAGVPADEVAAIPAGKRPPGSPGAVPNGFGPDAEAGTRADDAAVSSAATQTPRSPDTASDRGMPGAGADTAANASPLAPGDVPAPAPAGATIPVAVLDAEPPDPHHPPAGCRFHPRCPVGPLADPGRTRCLTLDPSQGARERRHAAACHFAAAEPR